MRACDLLIFDSLGPNTHMKMKNILDELVLCYCPITVICCFVSYLTSNSFEIQRISALEYLFFLSFFSFKFGGTCEGLLHR